LNVPFVLQVCVSSLKLRPVPRMAVDTPLYELLRVFQAGHSHMVVRAAALIDAETLMMHVNFHARLPASVFAYLSQPSVCSQ